MAQYPVKWFSNEMQGAPQQRPSAAGGLADILKACLVTGFGLTPATSLAWDAAAGMVVVTFASRHKFLLDSVIQVTGSSLSVYSGEYRVKKVTYTKLWFEMPSGYPGPVDAPSFSVKVAPVGWTLDHSSPDGQTLIMSPNDLASVGNVSLRVDNSPYAGWDSYGQYLARVQFVEGVISLDDYTLIDDWGWASTSDGGDGRWDLVGDPQLFYYLPAYGWYSRQSMYIWGYINSVRPDDRYHCVMHGFPTKDNVEYGSFTEPFKSVHNYGTRSDDYSYARRLARAYYQQGSTIRWTYRGMFSRFGVGMTYPNGPDHAAHFDFTPPMITEEPTGSFRGRMPGLVQPYVTLPEWNRANFLIDAGPYDKLVRFILINSYIQWDSPLEMVGFDLTGPWRPEE